MESAEEKRKVPRILAQKKVLHGYAVRLPAGGRYGGRQPPVEGGGAQRSVPQGGGFPPLAALIYFLGVKFSDCLFFIKTCGLEPKFVLNMLILDKK